MGWGRGGYGPSRDTRARYDANGKRVRQTFGTHANTAHVWAQNEFKYGRSSDGRIFFENGTIYSYGTHFAIAHFTGKKTTQGREIVLFNADGYSPSTGQHKSHVHAALRGLPIELIEISGLKSWSRMEKPSKAELRAAYEALITRAAIEQTPRSVNLVSEFRRAFGIRWEIPADFIAWHEARVTKAKAKAAARKVEDAKRILSPCLPTRALLTEWTDYKKHKESRSVEYALASLARDLKTFRSARLALRGAWPVYKARAKAIIDRLEPLKAPLEKRLNTLRRAEQRKRDLATLDRILKIATDKRNEDSSDWARKNVFSAAQIYRHDEAGRVWSLALKLKRSTEADLIGERLQLAQLDSEMNWRAPNRYAYRPPDRRVISLEDWYAGVGEASQYGDSFDMTRLRRKHDRLETSRGAEAVWNLSVLAFELAQRCRVTGTTWKRNGEKMSVGYYQIDSIDSGGNITAGCHFITWSESLRLALAETPERVRASYPLPVPYLEARAAA